MKTKQLRRQIEELEMQIKDLKRQVEESDQEQGQEWPMMGESYYMVSPDGPRGVEYDNDEIDQLRKERGVMLHTYEEAVARDEFFLALGLPIPINEVRYVLLSHEVVGDAKHYSDSVVHIYNAIGLAFRTKEEARSKEAEARLAAILKYGVFKNE